MPFICVHIARIPAADVLIEGLGKDEHFPHLCHIGEIGRIAGLPCQVGAACKRPGFLSFADLAVPHRPMVSNLRVSPPLLNARYQDRGEVRPQTTVVLDADRVGSCRSRSHRCSCRVGGGGVIRAVVVAVHIVVIAWPLAFACGDGKLCV